jgi:outer membrane protein assembly factor BamD
MASRIGLLVILLLLTLPVWADRAIGQSTTQTPEEQAAAADTEMRSGRESQGERNYAAAIGHFRVVVTQYRDTPCVPEALERLVENYLTLGIVSEAQTAVAVLRRKFLTSTSYAQARDILTSTGSEPVEDRGSWISKAFQ